MSSCGPLGGGGAGSYRQVPLVFLLLGLLRFTGRHLTHCSVRWRADEHHTNLPITGEPWERPSATCRVWAESGSHCTECYILCQGLSPVSFLNPHLTWVSKSRLSWLDLDKLEFSCLGWGRCHPISQTWQTVLDKWPPKTCM